MGSELGAAADAQCKELWDGFKGPQPGALAGGKFCTRDKPRVPGASSTQATHANNLFRNPLGLENDLAAFVGPNLQARVPSNVLEQLEGIARDNLVQFSSVAFLSLLPSDSRVLLLILPVHSGRRGYVPCVLLLFQHRRYLQTSFC